MAGACSFVMDQYYLVVTYFIVVFESLIWILRFKDFSGLWLYPMWRFLWRLWLCPMWMFLWGFSFHARGFISVLMKLVSHERAVEYPKLASLKWIWTLRCYSVFITESNGGLRIDFHFLLLVFCSNPSIGVKKLLLWILGVFNSFHPLIDNKLL